MDSTKTNQTWTFVPSTEKTPAGLSTNRQLFPFDGQPLLDKHVYSYDRKFRWLFCSLAKPDVYQTSSTISPRSRTVSRLQNFSPCSWAESNSDYIKHPVSVSSGQGNHNTTTV